MICMSDSDIISMSSNRKMSISKLLLRTLDFSIFVKNVGPEKVVPNWSGSLYLYLILLCTYK